MAGDWLMSGEIAHTTIGIDVPEINLLETVANVLSNGHVVHGYSSASSERVVKILATHRYCDSEPMLGFGVDGQAEHALGRALLTYAMRERDGLDEISSTQYKEIEPRSITTGYHDSRFDNIVWCGEFKLYKVGARVMAYSGYGGDYGISPLEVSADTPLNAITLLANSHYFRGGPNSRVSKLPALSID